MSLPQEQVTDANKLHSDGRVFLYQLNTRAGTLYLKADNGIEWQGNFYTGTAIQLDGLTQSTDGEKARPSLSFANPQGVYSAMAVAGAFNNIEVFEYTVLRAHLEADQNIFSQRSWHARLVSGLNRLSISLQLRDSLDGPRFLLPARQYVPPTFPSVSL